MTIDSFSKAIDLRNTTIGLLNEAINLEIETARLFRKAIGSFLDSNMQLIYKAKQTIASSFETLIYLMKHLTY